jgi:hypothetical protein
MLSNMRAIPRCVRMGSQRERLPDEVLDLFTDHLCAQSVWSRFRYHSLALHLASIGEERPNLECPHVR